MNINDVYEAEIWMVHSNNSCFKSFVKKTIVYKGKYNDYYDLNTRHRYVLESNLCTIGDMFIERETMVPISEIIETKKDNMTKGKILRKYKAHNSKGGKKI